MGRWLVPLLTLIGCGKSSLPPPETSPTPDGCTYPEGATDPMAQGEVLYPYWWNQAIHRDGVREASVELEKVPCNADDDIDWSPFDVLLFVSIPAW